MRAKGPARLILDKAYAYSHVDGLVELSRKLHLSRSTASRKINNPSSFTLTEAKIISKYTGMSLEELADL